MTHIETPKIHSSLLIAALAIVAPASVGCAESNTETTTPADTRVATVDEAASPAATPGDGDDPSTQTDEDITAAISAELQGDPDAGLHDIVVETSGGVVTLTGFVDSVSARNVAVHIADAAFGVLRVNPQLDVRGGNKTTPSD